MRIISKFVDYYDNVQGLGIDKEDVYLREANSIEHKDITQPILHDTLLNCPHTTPWERDADNKQVEAYRFNPMIVGFCGKHQLVYRFNNRKGNVSWLYSEEDVTNFIEDDPYNVGFKSLQKSYLPHKLPKWQRRFLRKRNWGSLFRSDFTQETIAEAFDEVAKINVDEVFQSTKSPTFLVHFVNHDRFGLNTKEIEVDYDVRLTNLDYQKIVDPYTAFQEISMYRSGVLGTGEPVMIEISNDDKRDAHGFDGRSFKTDSPGKKRKAKKK